MARHSTPEHDLPRMGDKTTEAVFNGESPKGFAANLVKVARRKLR